MLLADTKLTFRHDETLTRQTLTNPGQKVVIVDDDIAVGFAGDTPESALIALVGLRGRSGDEIRGALLSYTNEMKELQGVTKSFLIVERKPSARITLIRNGFEEDRTEVGAGWIGDHEAFEAFSRVYHSDASSSISDPGGRFLISMAQLVVMEDVASVGGYMVRVSGSREKGFRFGADPGHVLPDEMDAIFQHHPDEPPTLQLRPTPGVDPTGYVRMPVPGAPPTSSALAHYIPEAGVAWLHTHDRPWEGPHRLQAQSVAELVDLAQSRHGQTLDRELAQYVFDNHVSP